MPVRKGTAKKTVAKKAVAKKTTTPPVKSASVRKTTKPASAGAFMDLANQIAEAILGGQMDGGLVVLDDALNERLSQVAKQESAAAAKKSASSAAKTTTAPPKRTVEKTVTLTKDKTYKVAASFKKLAGARVKFLRHKVGDDKKVDTTKAVIEMLVDKPGSPKGKRIVVPSSALEGPVK